MHFFYCFVFLLQIRRLRLINNELPDLEVEVPFLVAVLKELMVDVEDLKETIIELTSKY